jgi:LPXTG-motif cell wall-anchored protein
MEEANKNVEPCEPCEAAAVTTLPKTGFDDVTPWILLAGALLALTGLALKRWSNKH